MFEDCFPSLSLALFLLLSLPCSLLPSHSFSPLLPSYSVLQGFSGFEYTASFFKMTHQNFTSDGDGWEPYEDAVTNFCNLNETEVR